MAQFNTKASTLALDAWFKDQGLNVIDQLEVMVNLIAATCVASAQDEEQVIEKIAAVDAATMMTAAHMWQHRRPTHTAYTHV